MNQIEFIKKWAKEGDRIEDINDRRFLFNGNTLFYLETGNKYDIEAITWQSPKVCRFRKTSIQLSFEGKKTGYREDWELVADYADEKEQENNGENTLYGIIAKELSKGSQPTGNIVYRLASEVEKRLKALEDKSK